MAPIPTPVNRVTFGPLMRSLFWTACGSRYQDADRHEVTFREVFGHGSPIVNDNDDRDFARPLFALGVFGVSLPCTNEGGREGSWSDGWAVGNILIREKINNLPIYTLGVNIYLAWILRAHRRYLGIKGISELGGLLLGKYVPTYLRRLQALFRLRFPKLNTKNSWSLPLFLSCFAVERNFRRLSKWNDICGNLVGL